MNRGVAWAAVLAFAGSGAAQQTVILVRHAEKSAAPAAGQDPPLSDAGKRRAEALRDHLKDAGVDVIYTSKFLRTQETAEPLRKAVDKPREELKAEMASLLKERHKDQTVLIVAHSGADFGVQTYIDQITGKANGITLGPNDYDRIFILTRKKDGAWGVIQARYGAPSKPAGKT